MYQNIIGRYVLTLLLPALLAALPAQSQNEVVFKKVDSLKALINTSQGQEL